MYYMCLPTSKPSKLPKHRQIYTIHWKCLGIDVTNTPPKINYWNMFTWFEDSKYYRLKSPPKENSKIFRYWMFNPWGVIYGVFSSRDTHTHKRTRVSATFSFWDRVKGFWFFSNANHFHFSFHHAGEKSPISKRRQTEQKESLTFTSPKQKKWFHRLMIWNKLHKKNQTYILKNGPGTKVELPKASTKAWAKGKRNKTGCFWKIAGSLK